MCSVLSGPGAKRSISEGWCEQMFATHSTDSHMFGIN